ncbi:hypothetical protein NP233_g6454 [Leucocoprinus birnbaumii]|uniref:Uncharacterized protein n=1 Tax=Leucocoprinus birnbaumii TaxID=56174 RepID=A0AAD5VS10_9AGAR|nr:hypothetical protein NP233_g6454 [Leucocoprinus birnbaumii]
MAPDRWVVVDDADVEGGITYNGNWFSDTGSQNNVGNFGPPYLGTLHGITTNGFLSFPFSGTAVQVWGTNNEANFNTDPDPTWECFIDGNSISRDAPFQFAENNWKFCDKSGLPDGNHTLRVEVKVQNPSQTFWLDQIRYIPSPSLSLENRTILLDNSDPAVQFDAQWTSLGGGANMTTKPGSIATVNFVGVSMSWYAFIPTELPHNGSQASWSIDGGQDNTFLLKGLPAGTGVSTVYNQRFFTTPDLPAGSHTVEVKFLGSQQTTPLGLDYIYVKNGSFPTSTDTTTPSTTSASSAGAGNSGQSNPDRQSDNGGSSKETPVGAIVGGVIGGLALLLLLAAGFLFFRRRRRLSRQDDRSTTTHQEISYTPTQYPLHQGGDSRRDLASTPSYMAQSLENPHSPPPILASAPSANMGSSLPRKLRQEALRGGYTMYHTSNPSYSEQTTTSTGSSPWNPSTETHQMLQHQSTLNERWLNQQHMVEVPPQYTQD